MKASLLLIDDDQDMLDFLVQKLDDENYNIISTTSPTEALDYISSKNVDVIVTDEQMPEMSGTELMARAKNVAPNTLRIVLTGNATLESAVEAINSGGVYRYLMKPVNIIDLALTLRQAIQQRELVNETRKLISVSQKQSNYIQDLETDYPGISGFETNAEGAILIEEPTETDSIEALIREINTEVEKSEELLGRFEVENGEA